MALWARKVSGAFEKQVPEVTKKLMKVNFENENRISLNCGFMARL